MVKGPGKVVVRGKCVVLGADVSNSIVPVRAGKALPFEPAPGCGLNFKMGRRGRIWWESPDVAGTLMWENIAHLVLSAIGQRANNEREPFILMVVGESDAGKSTLCTYLANVALGNGVSPCVVDADIGQGDIAPPSAIGAVVLNKHVVDLRDANANIFEFIGTISPAGVESLVADAISCICQRSKQLSDLLVVNTDGYVQDGGVCYKRLIAEKIRPDVIICMGENEPLQGALKSTMLRLTGAKTSEVARKSRAERSWRRYGQFIRFAGRGHLRKALPGIRFSYFGQTVSDLAPIRIGDHAARLENLFVGLGAGGRVVGFGIISRIDNEYVEIQTDVKEPDTIYLSNIRIGSRSAEQIIL